MHGAIISRWFVGKLQDAIAAIHQRMIYRVAERKFRISRSTYVYHEQWIGKTKPKVRWQILPNMKNSNCGSRALVCRPQYLAYIAVCCWNCLYCRNSNALKSGWKFVGYFYERSEEQHRFAVAVRQEAKGLSAANSDTLTQTVLL